jgi:hypothetical protein
MTRGAREDADGACRVRPLYQRARSRPPTIGIATPKEKREALEKLVAQVERLLHPVENVGGNARVEDTDSEQSFTSC